MDRGAHRNSDVPVLAFFIVGYAGGQSIIIVHEPSGIHVSGHGQYQPHVHHLVTGAPSTLQPQTRARLERHSHLPSPAMVCASVNPSGDALTAVASTLLKAKAVLVCSSCRAPHSRRTFTLLTDPQSIMAIGLQFMTSKVMERVPVPD